MVVCNFIQMGLCACTGSQKSKSMGFYRRPSSQMESYKKILTNSKQFACSISNVKLKKLSQKMQLSISMKIDGITHLELPIMSTSQQKAIRWMIQHQFSFNGNQEYIRNKNVLFQIYSKNKSKVGEVNVNLLLSANGPFHHDFKVQMPNSKQARLSFDLKISQIINVKAESRFVQIVLSKQVSHDLFYFALKTVIGNTAWKSQQSYRLRRCMIEEVENLSERSSKIQQQNLKKEKYTKKIPMGKLLQWSKSQHPQLPSFSVQIPYQQFGFACFELILFSASSRQPLSDPKLVGTLCFSFQKMKQNAFTIQQIDNIKYEVYYAKMEQKMQFHGDIVGDAKVQMKFMVQEHVRQMVVCVRTEDGISKTSPIFVQQSKSQQISNLKRINQSILANYVELEKLNKQRDSTSQVRNLQNLITSRLKEMCKILEGTCKESIKIFKYSNQKQLFKAQQTLVDIGVNILEYLKDENPNIIAAAWDAIKALLRRGQLNLANISFSLQQIEKIRDNDISSALQEKIRFSIKYQKLLYKMLQKSLVILNTKSFDEQKRFAQMFIAKSLFRVPVFRKQFLNCIVKKGDPQIPQWRGSTFSLSQDNYNTDLQTAFDLLFDWQTHFYKAFKNYPKSVENQQILEGELSKQSWKTQIQKRGGAFFSIIRQWVFYVLQHVVDATNIQWHYFPGYNKIIHGFLVQYKYLPLQNYTFHLRQCAKALLHNENLLNIFIVILFNKVNVYNQADVLRAIKMISIFFSQIQDQRTIFPTNFLYAFFFKGIKAILDADYWLTTAKILEIFYDYFHLFSIPFQIEVSLYFLGQVYFKYFLHWQQNVRHLFHYFLLMRIFREIIKISDNTDHNKNKLKQQYKNLVESRYQEMIKMIEDLQRLQQKRKKTFNENLHSKEDYFRKMVRKRNHQLTSINNFIEKSAEPKRVKTMKSIGIDSSLRQLPHLKQQDYKSQAMNLELKKVCSQRSRSNSSHKCQTNSEAAVKKHHKDSIQQTSVAFNQKMESFKALVAFIDSKSENEIKLPDKSQLVYVSKSFQQYAESYQQFLGLLKQKQFVLPKVSIGIPIDQNQIQPRVVDDW